MNKHCLHVVGFKTLLLKKVYRNGFSFRWLVGFRHLEQKLLTSYVKRQGLSW